MALTGPQKEALTKALVAAFPTDADLELLVNFKLGVGLNVISAPGIQHLLVLRVINWAEARGPRLHDLVVGALNQNPENPELQQVAEALGLDEGAGEFERIVIQMVPLEDVETWRAQMMASERAVCRVEIGAQGIGTGFLVGTGLVLTNYHVMESVIEGPDKPSDVVLRFDYKLSAGGKTVQKGTEHRLIAGTKWLAASSRVKDLDYALLRVAGKPAEQPVAGQPGAPPRGFLTPKGYAFKAGDPLFIIQHPKATPLKFAPGSVKSPLVTPNRVAYTVNTEEGSSGSPCFTSDWTPVALHHWGGSDHNRGVMFSAILADWQGKGVAGEVGQ